ncbi:MAG: hypothetical protein K0Q79_1038 [Flavipsychrobacter sp.]|jgi:hypothetical protein|nr:hypothetical protein [Flavipsychrobacter sp.]
MSLNNVMPGMFICVLALFGCKKKPNPLAKLEGKHEWHGSAYREQVPLLGADSFYSITCHTNIGIIDAATISFYDSLAGQSYTLVYDSSFNTATTITYIYTASISREKITYDHSTGHLLWSRYYLKGGWGYSMELQAL